MTNIGFGELFVVLAVGMISAIPLAIAIWAIVMLRRISSSQEIIRNKIDAIERLLLNKN